MTIEKEREFFFLCFCSKSYARAAVIQRRSYHFLFDGNFKVESSFLIPVRWHHPRGVHGKVKDFFFKQKSPGVFLILKKLREVFMI